MLTLRDFVGQQLEWKRPRLFTQAYELRSVENHLLATLSYQGSVWRRRVVAEAGGEQWVFRREGFFQNAVAAYAWQGEEQAALPLVTVKHNWRGGSIVLADGRAYNWRSSGMLRPIYSITTPEDMTLLQLKRGRLLEIEPFASTLHELPVLVVLSFYLVLIAEEETASAAVMAVTV